MFLHDAFWDDHIHLGSASLETIYQTSLIYKCEFHLITSSNQPILQIHTVPNELLDMIMSLIVDPDWKCTDVLRLRSVSVLWKNVAEKCCRLWYKLSIAPPGHGLHWGSSLNVITSINLLKKYLHHSNVAQLDITVHFPSPNFLESKEAREGPVAIRTMLLELLKHSGRWIAFQLLVDTDCITDSEIDDLFDLFWQKDGLYAAKNLETLAICHSEFPHFDTQHHFQNACPSSSHQSDGSFRLRRLRCDTSVHRFTSAMLQHITVLSIAHQHRITIPVDSMLAVLEHTPCLLDLTLRSMTFRNVLPVRHFRNLKAIRFINTPLLDAAMSSFSAPILETIQVLSESQSRAPLSYDSFKRLMGSSEALSLIKEVDVSGALVSNIELQKVLRGCISATHMTFRAAIIDEARTGIFKFIRDSIPGRLRALGVEQIDITIAGWIGGGRANISAMGEWNRLKGLSTSFSDDGRFVFRRGSRSRS
jgi:hypothetical protein